MWHLVSERLFSRMEYKSTWSIWNNNNNMKFWFWCNIQEKKNVWVKPALRAPYIRFFLYILLWWNLQKGILSHYSERIIIIIFTRSCYRDYVRCRTRLILSIFPTIAIGRLTMVTHALFMRTAHHPEKNKNAVLLMTTSQP